jgi:signal peptidase I
MLQFSSENQGKRWFQRASFWIILIIAIIAAGLWLAVVVAPHSVGQAQELTLDGNAMSPIYPKGAKVKIQTKPIYIQGDIIAFKDPQHTNLKHVRRVVAIGGELVQLSKGTLLVDGFKVNEPYDPDPARQDYGPFRVPLETLFVLGDNRNNSTDSREFGPIPLTYILGAVVE